MITDMSGDMQLEMQREALVRCQSVLPGWRDLWVDDFDFDAPKGFSSFTMGIRAKRPVDPPAVLYRHLDGKENAILDAGAERDVFLLLGEHDIAAHCHLADETCRVEAFHDGRTLTRDDVFDATVQRGIADELFRLHQLEPPDLPDEPFFELLHLHWSALGRPVLTEHRHELPDDEQQLCDELLSLYDETTMAQVRRHLPDRPPVFCHNDTYHGNVMQLTDGTIRLLDFEFSCLGHVAFDFANLFAETVMRHGFDEPPHFRIAEPDFTDDDLARFVGYYLDNRRFDTPIARRGELDRLVAETRRAIPLSDFMYAMAAIPLALQPVQKIRFIPYAHQRFRRFLAASP
ncbi:phosphotransferase [Ilumatobacter sp.]|uniref:phosphotransferase n=1 Tax=Ilumatobacter sp. TaxID=1967498 RepID=UPI003AF4DA86